MSDRIEESPRPEGPELLGFYSCPAARCPVKWFPVTVGDRCPACGGPGVYAGVVAKIPTVPPASDGDGELD